MAMPYSCIKFSTFFGYPPNDYMSAWYFFGSLYLLIVSSATVVAFPPPVIVVAHMVGLSLLACHLSFFIKKYRTTKANNGCLDNLHSRNLKKWCKWCEFTLEVSNLLILSPISSH